MDVYSYQELKKAVSEVRVELLMKGTKVEKKVRRKPRNTEKRKLLFQKALDRLNIHPPRMIENCIILPYFYK